MQEVAKYLKKTFIWEPVKRTRPIPNLELNCTPKLEEMGIKEEMAKYFEVGLVKQRSIMKRRIAFKVYDTENSIRWYIGNEVKKDGRFYPKGFKRNFGYHLNRLDTEFSIVVDL